VKHTFVRWTNRLHLDRSLKEEDLTVHDLSTSGSKNSMAHFHNFHLTADCNENIFYMLNNFYHFFKDLPKDKYLYTSTPIRRDTYKLNDQLGLQLIWEEAPKKDIHGINMAKRFYEGVFTFLDKNI